MAVSIIYEDNDIMVVHKPAGLATQTSKIGQPDLVSEIKNYLARPKWNKPASREVPYVGVVHRLDQPVEGLLVFAKNRQAAAALTRQLSSKEDECALNKQYLAVVCGKPQESEGMFVDYLIKTPDNTAEVVPSDNKAAKRAVLRYKTISTCKLKDACWDIDENDVNADDDISMVLISIETGRFHQIRVQMSHAGLPLLGDQKYGTAKAKVNASVLGVRTVALCAYSIRLIHPTTGEELYFEKEPESKAYSFFMDSTY